MVVVKRKTTIQHFAKFVDPTKKNSDEDDKLSDGVDANDVDDHSRRVVNRRSIKCASEMHTARRRIV